MSPERRPAAAGLRWVVKLGGSLLGHPALADWLARLVRHAAAGIVVVPGGGPFADLVRERQRPLGYDDAAAHDMALLAMAQTASLLRALAPALQRVDDRRTIPAAVAAGRVALWAPLDVVREAPVAPGWDLTSDSLALWLAAELAVPRVALVKSCALPAGAASRAAPDEVQRWADAGLVDARFPTLYAARPVDLRLWSRDDGRAAERAFADTP